MSTDGVRKIIEEIEKSTEQKCSEILSEAKEKVEAVLNEARKKASEEEGTILARGEQEARRESQRILAEARIKARREKVKAQEVVVQKSFDTARKTLLKMAEEKKAAELNTGMCWKGLSGNLRFLRVFSRLRCW